MTMDVSSLGIEVKSTGIKEASQALSGLGTSAANAETKVNKLTDAVERLLKLNVPVTMQAWAASMNAMANAMNGVGAGAQRYAMALTNGSTASQQAATVTNTLNQQFNNQANILVNLTNNVNTYAASTNRAAAESEGWTSRTGVMLNTLKAMTTAFLYYKGIALAKSIVEDADEYTNLNAKMVVATHSQSNANIAMKDSYQISQQLRTSYKDTAELMSRMELIMNRTGHTYGEVKTTVTGLAAALHLYGATTQESSSAMLAYAHSASTGLVHMRTLNSLMTSAPLLLQAFQDATGKSGEELRKMSTKGQLSFEMLNKALAEATPRLLEQFDHIPITFAGAMQRIKNAWLFEIGQMGRDTGFNTAMAKSLRIVEDMIPAVARGLGNAFITVMQWIDKNKDGLSAIGTQVGGLITDIIQIGEDIASWLVEVTGASNGLELVANAIYGIRLGLAYAEDAFKAIGIAVTFIGGAIGLFIATPLSLVVSVLGYAIQGFGKLLSIASAASIAQGDLASGMMYQLQASQAEEFGKELSKATEKTYAASTAALDLGQKWADAFDNGQTAVDKLLHGTEEAQAKLKGMKVDFGGVKNWDTPGYQEDSDLAIKRAKALAAAREAANAKLAQAELKENNKQQEALASLNTEYEKLIATKISLAEGSGGVKVGPAQTEYLRLENEIIAAKHKEGLLNQAQIVRDLEVQLGKAAINAELERYNELTQKSDAADKKMLDKETALTQVLKDQLASLEKRNAAFRNPNGKEDLTNAKASDIQTKLDAAQGNLANHSFIEGATTDAIEKQQELVKTYQQQLDLLGKLAVQQHINSQNNITTEWDKLFDDKKSLKFTDALTKGFGAAGKAVAGVANAMRTMAINQEAVAKAQKLAADTEDGPLKKQREMEALAFAQEMQINNYANMAQAAQGFFKKGTEGYKVMGDVEKAFRIAEAAMAIENFALKSGLMSTETALAIAGYIKTGLASVESAAVQLASALGLGPVLAALGVATQAQGDPYSAWGRMAAMAAAMAALGFAVSGANHGGSGPTAAQQQASQGTGTILGDATKQSQSIDDSLKAMKSNSNISLKYSSQMVMSLQNIEAALTGVTNAIISGNGAITGSNFTASKTGFSKQQASAFGYSNSLINPLQNVALGFTQTLDKLTGGLLSKLAGVSTKTTLRDSGISSGNQSIGSVLSGGFQGSQYQTVDTASKAFFGLVNSTKTSTNKSALDPSIADAFTSVIKSMVSTVTAAASGLGANATNVAKQLDNVTVSLGNISLKGLTAAQITTQLNAVFSSFGDKLVTAALGPLLTGFQQAGEGLLQTAVRVASGVDEANGELSKLGLTAIHFKDIINKSGDVAAEIVRQTILMKEAGTGLGDIISTMSDTAANIGDTYTGLLAVRTSLQDLGIAKDVSANLLAVAGGMSALQAALDSYKKNFFSSAEQQAMGLADLQKQFSALGLSMPSTKAGFRALVDSLSASGATGQALATKVVLLSDAFSNLYSTVDDNVSKATSDLTDAYNNQASAIQTAKTAFEGFATSLQKFKTTLMTGDLSVDNAVQKYQTEKALYDKTQAAAAAGDQTALADFQQVAQDFLTASRGVYASGAQYTTDYQQVLQQTDALQQYSENQSSVQDKQLAALNQQVNGLITVNSSVLTVAQAIANLQAVMTTGLGGSTSAQQNFSFGGVSVPTTFTGPNQTIMPVTPSVNGSHALGLARVPYDGYLAQLHKDERVLTAQESRAYQQGGGSSNAQVVAELAAVKATLASLRDGQREQTAALVAATYDSNAQNADAINEGAKDAVKDASYQQRAKATLA